MKNQTIHKQVNLKIRKFRFIVLIITSTILIACASLPEQLKEDGSVLLKECDEINSLENANYGAIYLSVSTDAMVDSWYLPMKKKGNERETFFIKLPGIKIGIPEREKGEWYRFAARYICYLAPAGEYTVSQIKGLQRNHDGSSILLSYQHSQNFSIKPNIYSYLGRLLIDDTDMKDKGYFDRAGVIFKKFFSSKPMLPENIEIRILNEYNEDTNWLKSTNPNIYFETINFVDTI